MKYVWIQKIVSCLAFGLYVFPALSAPLKGTFSHSVTRQFKVTAIISNGCEFKDSNKVIVNLPNMGISHPQSQAQVQFQLECTPDTTVKITLDNGQHANAQGQRQLKLDNQNSFIPYLIYYVNGSQKTIWKSVQLNSDQLNQPITLEADVKETAQQAENLQPGHYSDAVTMTVQY